MKSTKHTAYKPCISFINGKIYIRKYDEETNELKIISEIENEYTSSKNIGHKTEPEQSEND
jgi:hypothetical protein